MAQGDAMLTKLNLYKKHQNTQFYVRKILKNPCSYRQKKPHIHMFAYIQREILQIPSLFLCPADIESQNHYK